VTTPRRKRPTIREVADVAGVSRGTVSRVLTGAKWVSAESAAAVADAIARTGYTVNPHARSLATHRSNSVAFLLTEPQHLLFEDPNFSMLLRGAAAALTERKIALVLIIAGTPAERAQATEYLSGGHVDGVLLVSTHSGNPIVSSLVKAGVPTVAVGAPAGFETKVGYVSADDFGGGKAMVEYLISRGRHKIAHISGPLDTPGGIGRLAGYEAALGDKYDESLVAHGDYSRASGVSGMEDLLRRHPDLDAVFAANDVMATGALGVLQAAGKSIPDDVSVGGFDDSGFATTSTPPLTTMRQPFERISSEVVRLLVEVIEGNEPAAIMLPTTLVVRESA